MFRIKNTEMNIWEVAVMISVIIPTYNREKTILNAVNSVLKQTYKDIEVIVVDDGSKDNTAQVFKHVKDSRVKYIYQENAGACVARNNGIKHARGEYIAFNDSDDIWYQDKLLKQISVIEKENVDVVFCKVLKKEMGKEDMIMPMSFDEGIVKMGHSLFGIGTQTIMAKREVFENEKFDPELPRFQECELLLRIQKHFKIYCLNEALVEYNLGEDSISYNPHKLITACKIILKKHPNFLDEYPNMGKTMAERMISEVDNSKNSELKKEMYHLVIKCDRSMKNYLKVFLSKIGLYRYLKK